MNVTKTTGLALAIAAAGLMATTTANAYGSKKPEASKNGSAEVHCYGVTACKGHNDCKTAENACKGKAACKGHGFLAMTKEACAEAGGTVGK